MNPLTISRRRRHARLIVLSQLLAGDFDGVEPNLEFFWLLRALVAALELLHQIHDIALGYALLAQSYRSDEAVKRDELLFDLEKHNPELKWLRGIGNSYVNSRLVPPNQLGLDLVGIEDRNCSAIAHAAGALNGTTAALFDRRVDSSQAVVVESGKVQLADVPSIVHVPNKDVNVVCGANA